MNYIVSFNDLENLKKYKKYTNNFLLGLNKYSVGMNTYYDVNQIINIIKNNTDCNFYLNLNRLVISDDIYEIKNILLNLKEYNNLYFITTDLGVLNISIDNDFSNKVIINLENLTTNYYDFNFYAKFNILGSFISNEIKYEDLKLITEKKEYKSFYNGLGYIPMFNSRRSHISNYLKENYIDDKTYDKYKYYLIEETRNEKYKILEENNHFIVYRPNMFYFNNQENIDLDYFVFNNIFLSDEKTLYLLDKVIKGYDLDIEYDDGFLTKEIVYKKG